MLKTVDNVNTSLDDLRLHGKNLLKHITIEEYHEKTKRKRIKPVIPTAEEARKFRQDAMDQPTPVSSD